MRFSPVLAAGLILIANSAGAVESILYEDFQDGMDPAWRAFGDGAISLSEYDGNFSLRMSKDSMATIDVSISGLNRIRIGASFAAYGLGQGSSCIAEATVDDGKSWFEIVRVENGSDDGITMHASATSQMVPAAVHRAWIRARVDGGSSETMCWLDNVFVAGQLEIEASADGAKQQLSSNFLLGSEDLVSPTQMVEFTPPRFAVDDVVPKIAAALRLKTDGPDARYEIHVDELNRIDQYGEAVTTLPPVNFDFVVNGGDVIPIQRGVLRTDHPYWEVIYQPGRIWRDRESDQWWRVSIPFALQERSANCTHNGVMSWLMNKIGEISRVAYQISSETCAYLKLDMWGVASAELELKDAELFSDMLNRVDDHANSKMPVRPLEALGELYPDLEPMSFGYDDGINPDDMTVLGLVVDGVHYRSSCGTRHGPFPYCDSLPLPSYSTAKSIFAGVGLMRMESLVEGASLALVESLVDECKGRKWRDVSLENVLDMATGNYRSIGHSVDEDSEKHLQFVFGDRHVHKLQAACSIFPRKSQPGSQFVYHTSDTYILGAALSAQVGAYAARNDFYEWLLVEPIWKKLSLSPLLDDSKRTYDEYAQPFVGYGLTVEADDVIRIAAWLNSGEGKLGDETLIDASMLEAALQRRPSDRGLPAINDSLRYNNGFWAYDAGPSIGCENSVWVPFMSGVSGITVAMFPNDIIYYYFSDSEIFRWQSGRIAAHSIRSLCH